MLVMLPGCHSVKFSGHPSHWRNVCCCAATGATAVFHAVGKVNQELVVPVVWLRDGRQRVDWLRAARRHDFLRV